MNSITEKEALSLAEKLVTLYYERRATAQVLPFLDTEISCIGTGEGEVSHSLSELYAMLEQECAEYSGRFSIQNIAFRFTPMAGGGMLHGTLLAVPEDRALSAENVRITAVLGQTDHGPKVLHLHFSHSDAAQGQGAHFVRESLRGSNADLLHTLNLREQQLANLTKNIPGGAHQCAADSELTLLSMSDGFLSMFGYTREDVKALFDDKFLRMVYPADRKRFLRSMREQLHANRELELEYRVLCKDGPPIWVLDHGRRIGDGYGGICYYCLLVDITKRRRQQEELRLSLERHQVIMDQSTDTIFEWDIQRDTLSFSANWKKKFGYTPICQNISCAIPLSKNIHADDIPAFVQLMENTRGGTPYAETEFRIQDRDGRFYWCRVRATVQFDSDGNAIKAIGVITDIDAEKKQKQNLLQQAQRDALTGIYNKATINALVEQRMDQRRQLPGMQVLFFIDVDHFKAVNDTYGHLSGDTVLSDVAAALIACVRSSDLVGRIGGDEFIVYLPDIPTKKAAEQKAERLLAALNCIRPDVNAPPISCSIGAVIVPHSCTDYRTLYRNADAALYRCKNTQRGSVRFWDITMPESADTDQPVTAVGNSIVSDEGNVADEWLAQYAFRTLYEAKDTQAAMERLLEIIGRSFDVSRTYIIENAEDGKSCSNTFEWCGEGVTPQIDALQDLPYVGALHDYAENFSENGIFHCQDVENLPKDIYDILKPQGIRSMLQCAMLDEGKFVGYMGFDECRQNRVWSDRQVAAFKLTADVLSTFIMKLRLKQKKTTP